MDGKQNPKQRRGSNNGIGNAGNEKGKKSKRPKKNKTRKKQYLERDNDVATLISNLSLQDTGPDSDIANHFAFTKNGSFKKVSSSTSTATSSGNDEITKDSLNITDVKKGKNGALWLTDNVIKENFLKMSDQAADFDEGVWKSIKLSLCQKANNSLLSAKYNRLNYTNNVPQFDYPPSAPQAESLRWEFKMDSDSEEEERLRVYKINRRKRFLAERYEKGLELISGANNQTEVLQPTISTSYFDLNDGPVLSNMINHLGFSGADDSREMVLNCS
ncbi:uncharacterized protein LOC135503615 [Lineus longissimus]|uniref:uncharacterized protein LOC135503615 n=1 Tax=Lineus longissimus TaxID=88925 RepID=UPI002B4DCA41